MPTQRILFDNFYIELFFLHILLNNITQWHWTINQKQTKTSSDIYIIISLLFYAITSFGCHGLCDGVGISPLWVTNIFFSREIGNPFGRCNPIGFKSLNTLQTSARDLYRIPSRKCLGKNKVIYHLFGIKSTLPYLTYIYSVSLELYYKKRPYYIKHATHSRCFYFATYRNIFSFIRDEYVQTCKCTVLSAQYQQQQSRKKTMSHIFRIT